MAATFTVSGNNIKIDMGWEVSSAKAQAVIFAVAENLWVEETNDDGEVTNPFANATSQEKLNVAYKHVGRVLLDMADTFISQKDQLAAREAAVKHDLGI